QKIRIPVYMCDSVATRIETRQTDIEAAGPTIETVEGTFAIPSVCSTQDALETLAGLLEKSIREEYHEDEFIKEAKKSGGLAPFEYTTLVGLYRKIRELHRIGRNWIWARLLKNAFAPVFAGKFDFVAGNPPWIRWGLLAEKYRERTADLWRQ